MPGCKDRLRFKRFNKNGNVSVLIFFLSYMHSLVKSSIALVCWLLGYSLQVWKNASMGDKLTNLHKWIWTNSPESWITRTYLVSLNKTPSTKKINNTQQDIQSFYFQFLFLWCIPGLLIPFGVLSSKYVDGAMVTWYTDEGGILVEVDAANKERLFYFRNHFNRHKQKTDLTCSWKIMHTIETHQ